jgi:hypothetical protein
VGKVPNSAPPVVIVRFDPAQTSAETIVQAAKAGLESDPFNTSQVAVTLEPAAVQAPATLESLVRFSAMDLWVRPLEGNVLRLNTELFDCGTCSSQAVRALQQTPGVLETHPDASPAGTALLVTYDPGAISAEQVADVARQTLEADPLLPTTVAVHFYSPD